MSIAMALRPQAATAPAMLKRLSQPLLLIWGLEDRLVPVLVAEQVGRLRPDLPLELIEGSGHCPHDEHPDTFNALLLQWLAQLPGSGPAASPGR
jgi:pimeloyl-ACP methyl ester carboxylesterase